jgi:hypothetical protein
MAFSGRGRKRKGPAQWPVPQKLACIADAATSLHSEAIGTGVAVDKKMPGIEPRVVLRVGELKKIFGRILMRTTLPNFLRSF